MKTVGIVGGIAPESTIQYYRLIIAGYHEHKRDGNYPSILINSINMKQMLDLIGAKRLPELIRYLKGEIDKLARAGADFGVLQAVSPIPLISIVRATCHRADELGLKRAGLFGTRFTMQGGFYEREFKKRGIVVVLPADDDQAYIHEKYMTELVN